MDHIENHSIVEKIISSLSFIMEVIILSKDILLSQVEVIYKWGFPKPRKHVQGRVVLVTGSASGIGRKLAIKFGNLGCKVVLWDIDEEGNKETAATITDAGGKAYPCTCDVRKIDQVKKSADDIRQQLGGVDILINNAGVLICKHLLELSEKDITTTMETNTLAHFWTVKEVLPDMINNNYGHIVTISSMSAVLGVAMVADYSASKFATVGFSEALADEIHRMGLEKHIKTTTVFPYMVNTKLLSSISNRVQQKSRFDSPMEPEDVAEQIVEGVLREKEWIHVPAKTTWMHVIKALMSRKAVRQILEFTGSGYFPVIRAHGQT